MGRAAGEGALSPGQRRRGSPALSPAPPQGPPRSSGSGSTCRCLFAGPALGLGQDGPAHPGVAQPVDVLLGLVRGRPLSQHRCPRARADLGLVSEPPEGKLVTLFWAKCAFLLQKVPMSLVCLLPEFSTLSPC